MPDRVLLTAVQVASHIKRLAQEIARDLGGGVVVLGIQTRGVLLAKRIAEALRADRKTVISVGSLDITLYRDDVGAIEHQPLVKETDIPAPIDGCPVILVDDVLYTGRTIRAALDAIMDFGRPQGIRLAVLVDRGLRELPIQADYVGHRLATSPEDQIEVRMKEIDGEDLVVLKGPRAAHSKVPHAPQR